MTFIKILLRILVMVGFVWSVVAGNLLQAATQGQRLYSLKKYKSAQSQLLKEVRSARDRNTKSVLYMYLGLAVYRSGNASKSYAFFRQAVVLNPNVRPPAADARDRRFMRVFRKIYQTYAGGGANSVGKSTAPASKLKRTSLVIDANVKSGRVYVDGILAGNVGSPLEVEAGIVVVEVKAKGYNTLKAKIRIRKGQENRVALKLVAKPDPRVVKAKRMKALQLARQKRAAAKRAKSQRQNRQRVSAQASASGTSAPLPAPDLSDDLFGTESSLDVQGGSQLADEFSREATLGQPLTQQQGYAPQYQAPYGATPYGATPYGGYTPAYPTQPYGYYPPQPMYMSPPQPVYAPPPQPVYTAPAPVPAPIVSDVSSADIFAEPVTSTGSGVSSATAPIEIADIEDVAPIKKVRKKKRRRRVEPVSLSSSGRSSRRFRKRKKSSSSNNVFVSLMPMGIGQFYQGKYLLGAAVAAAQVGGLYVALQASAAAETQAQDANQVNNDPTISDADKEKHVNDSNAFIESKNSEKTIGFVVFGAAWGIGAIEAIMNPPRSKPKRRSKRRYGLLDSEQRNRLSSLSEMHVSTQDIYTRNGVESSVADLANEVSVSQPNHYFDWGLVALNLDSAGLPERQTLNPVFGVSYRYEY